MLIRDVIHNDISISNEIILDLISTYEFQRLRKIKQLGLTYTIFPSAEHTRFSHSIGVYYLSKKMIEVLEEKRKMQFEKNEKLALNIASLLHDVGHGPLSHTAEEFFNYSHEDYSVAIILDENTGINKVLKKYCPELIDEILIYIKKKHPNKILNKVLSNTIDIDRMDYLFRDSHHAGVVYGKFDVNRLFKIIDVVDDELVFLEKGRQTLEDFIMSRYHMFGQVYLNKRTIGIEHLVRVVLERTEQLIENNYRFKTNIDKLKPFFKNEVSIKDYVRMNDYVLISIIEEMAYKEKDQILIDYARAFTRQTQLVTKDELQADKEYYSFESNNYEKSIYNESVKILRGDGTICDLEEISQLVNFIKNSLKITCKKETYYLEKNES